MSLFYIYLYINLRRSRDGAFMPSLVRAFMCHSVVSALASFYADCPHKPIIKNNESVQRQEEHSSGINTIT